MNSCRICLDASGILISPCHCKGSIKNIHISCLYNEIISTKKLCCSICKQDYKSSEINTICGLILNGLEITTYCATAINIVLDFVSKGIILFFKDEG